MGRESNLRERGAMGTPKSKQLWVGGTQCKREENCREASGGVGELSIIFY